MVVFSKRLFSNLSVRKAYASPESAEDESDLASTVLTIAAGRSRSMRRQDVLSLMKMA